MLRLRLRANVRAYYVNFFTAYTVCGHILEDRSWKDWTVPLLHGSALSKTGLCLYYIYIYIYIICHTCYRAST